VGAHRPRQGNQERGELTSHSEGPAQDVEAERGGGSFYGRRKGRPLRAGQRKAIETVLPKLLIDVSRQAPASLSAFFDVPIDAVRMEIGFGGGEHLLHAARSNPAVGFIGIEPFENGLAKAVTAIAREGLRNIRLYDQDAALVLDWLPAQSIARIDLLFPDPWPKKRHWKRRFVSQGNLARIARVLNDGGVFRFATDVESYAEWTRDEVAKHGKLESVGESSEPWSDWPGTRYEAKAARAGRGARYLTFRRP
jgi:tRNA (guanine-N7-)-methyltransferase